MRISLKRRAHQLTPLPRKGVVEAIPRERFCLSAREGGRESIGEGEKKRSNGGLVCPGFTALRR